jgi:hypothetical protein
MFWIFILSQSKSNEDDSSRIVEISDEEAERILEEEKQKAKNKEEKSEKVSQPDPKADEDESEEDKGRLMSKQDWSNPVSSLLVRLYWWNYFCWIV